MKIEERVKEVLELTDDWNEIWYREYWEYVRDTIDGLYDELSEEEKDEIYHKVMEQV